MRVLLKLQALEDSLYEMQYHHHLQGFIYSLLRGTRFHHIHDKKGYKFFCFSNIFPIGEIRRGGVRNLLVSSPDEEFIKVIHERLLKISDNAIRERMFESNYCRIERLWSMQSPVMCYFLNQPSRACWQERT